MRAKKIYIILFYRLIKILFHSLSLSLSLTVILTPFEALILSQNSLKQTLSNSHPLLVTLPQGAKFTTKLSFTSHKELVVIRINSWKFAPSCWIPILKSC